MCAKFWVFEPNYDVPSGTLFVLFMRFVRVGYRTHDCRVWRVKINFYEVKFDKERVGNSPRRFDGKIVVSFKRLRCCFKRHRRQIGTLFST